VYCNCKPAGVDARYISTSWQNSIASASELFHNGEWPDLCLISTQMVADVVVTEACSMSVLVGTVCGCNVWCCLPNTLVHKVSFLGKYCSWDHHTHVCVGGGGGGTLGAEHTPTCLVPGANVLHRVQSLGLSRTVIGKAANPEAWHAS
jgi:hypothetical protein